MIGGGACGCKESSGPRAGTVADAPPAPAGPSTPGVLLLAYLCATLLPLLLGGVSGGRGLVVVAHVAVLAAVALLEARRGGPGRGAPERTLADWHLLLLLPALYAELPWLMEGVATGYHDSAVAALESRLFGGQPAFQWAGAWPLPWVSEPLHAAYLAYYPVIYVPPILLYVRAVRSARSARGRPSRGSAGREALDAHHETVTALGLAMLSCYLVFVAWPVQGPRYLGVPQGIPDGPLRALTLLVLESGSSRGAAFPSSHVSVAVAQTLVALRLQPRVGVLLAAVTPLLAAGAVYGGFHYATDVVAGALVGAAAAAVAPALHRLVIRRTGGAARGFTSPDDDI